MQKAPRKKKKLTRQQRKQRATYRVGQMYAKETGELYNIMRGGRGVSKREALEWKRQVRRSPAAAMENLRKRTKGARGSASLIKQFSGTRTEKVLRGALKESIKAAERRPGGRAAARKKVTRKASKRRTTRRK